MRRIVILSTFVVCLLLAVPAEAQLRGDTSTEVAPALVYGAGGPGFSLSSLFRPGTFRMEHAVEMSVGSFGGQTSSLGMYTNSLIWNFSPKLAGIFGITGLASDELGPTLGSYCPGILIPYARELVANLAIRGGFPSFILAPINFEKLYQEHISAQFSEQQAKVES